MQTHLDATRYHELQALLIQLQSAHEPDVEAINVCIEELAIEQRRLKAEDGQHGNNPIEARYQQATPFNFMDN